MLTSKALLEAQTPVVTIFGKTWLLHVKEALHISEEENLEIIGDSVLYLKNHGKEVVYDAEHFFDGYKSDKTYAMKTLDAAQRGGAHVIVLCDTNGGTLTHEVAEIVHDIKRAAFDTSRHPYSQRFRCRGRECHRCYPKRMCSRARDDERLRRAMRECKSLLIIPNLQMKLGYQCVGDEGLKSLTQLSHYVSELANLTHRKSLAYVGESAFAHKGGVHVSAVMKTPATYEHIHPEDVGNVRRVLISDLSGRSNVLYKAKELGIDIDDKSPEVQNIVDDLKELEHYGYQYEDAEGSFELLVKKKTKQFKEFFVLEGFKVIIHKESYEASLTRKRSSKCGLATKPNSQRLREPVRSTPSTARCEKRSSDSIRSCLK